MGSFMGHVVPGTFFSGFALWWTWAIFHKYFLCQREATFGGEKRRNSRYTNTLSFHCPCNPRIPFEGIIKVVSVIIGMTGEFATAFENGKFTHINNAQHMTMFFFFGINGVMDILHHYRFPLPPDTDYISGVLAFIMEGLLFFYHLHGRSSMDIQVHMLLFYVVVCCAVASSLEMKYKSNVLPALSRTYFTLLQGTWFFQVGFILYSPFGSEWDQEDHRQMMIVTLIFTWHNAAIFVFMALSGTLICLRVRNMPRDALYYSLVPVSGSDQEDRLSSKLDAEEIRKIIADSEEDV